MGTREDRMVRSSPVPGVEVSSENTPVERADELNHIGLSRRELITTMSLLTVGVTVGLPAQPALADTHGSAETTAHMCSVELTINGQEHKFMLDPRVTLLDLLREQMSLTGTKKGCDHGQCGACTVLANGRRINSCLSLAVAHQGETIVTIEGLAREGELHPMQAAFLQHDGFQCGYCTPGQICSAVAMLNEAGRGDASIVTADLTKVAPVHLTGDEIRERMSGNICRCGAYPGIVQAIQSCIATRGNGNESL
jgi:xanthine dehydrogenase YagT iron-sulfur-binding subunit